jgi:hypothetical protein
MTRQLVRAPVELAIADDRVTELQGRRMSGRLGLRCEEMMVEHSCHTTDEQSV